MRRILLLGASGSIGTQSLDIINSDPSNFDLVGFSVGNRVECIPTLINQYKNVKYIYLIDKKKAKGFAKEYPFIKFYFGNKGLAKITKQCQCDMVVDALVGFAGMEPAIIALKRNKILCLANKEALVTGGTIINSLLNKGYGKLYPIDSEHVALAKCINKVGKENVKKILITASGGALRDTPLDKLSTIKAEEALKHPTWNMGAKITIDCATMMNKGFEIIEAYYLFGYKTNDIEVVMHRESLIHSMVLTKDNTYVLDYGKPDMHNPIRYALYESKLDYDLETTNDYKKMKDCSFFEFDENRYPCVELAKKCLEQGASKMIALNAANEVAVNRYLKGEISFTQIRNIVDGIVNNQKIISNPSISLIKYLDKHARRLARKAQ